ncbi:MAG: c-type cytochrome [Ferruginibacter sp.]
MKWSNKILVIAGIAAFVIMGMTAMRPHDTFKNLKVLPKDISEDSLMTIMETYESSLGVTCSHCHVLDNAEHKEDYASDAIHDKEECRDMMRMTDSINKEYFPRRNPARPLKITCYTCHHGKSHPEREIKKLMINN